VPSGTGFYNFQPPTPNLSSESPLPQKFENSKFYGFRLLYIALLITWAFCCVAVKVVWWWESIVI